MFSIRSNIKKLKKSSTLAINETVRSLRKSKKQVFHFGFGQSPFEIEKSIVSELKKHAPNHDYLETAGLLELREEVSKYLYKRFKYKVSKDNVLIGPGSKELIYQSILVLDATVLIPSPSWVSYLPQVVLAKGKQKYIKTSLENNYKVTAKELSEICKKTKGEKVLILNNPNNPTGAVYSDKELKDIAKVAKKYKLMIIADEIYSEITFERKFRSMGELYPEGTIVTGGLSKGFSAGGYRLGFMTIPKGNDDLRKALLSSFSETFSSVSSPIQYAAIEAFKYKSNVKSYLDKCSKVHSKASHYLYDRFIEMGLTCSKPEGSFYLFIGFGPYKKKLKKLGLDNDHKLADYLLKKYRVALLPGADFMYPEKDLCFRVATVDYSGKLAIKNFSKIKTPTYVDKFMPNLVGGCDQIKKFLESL